MVPRLLLLEDDPLVAGFLGAVLASLPARVEHAATIAAARTLADASQALWLFDAQLPDGRASALLPRLRARGLRVPALALTASSDPESLAELRAAGFAQVLSKPIAGDALRAIVRGRLAAHAGHEWDDDGALSALGDADAVRAMRTLFLRELPAQRAELHAALGSGDFAAAQALLHRLKAACGFVGAAALLRAVQALSADPRDAGALARFDAGSDALAGGSVAAQIRQVGHQTPGFQPHRA